MEQNILNSLKEKTRTAAFKVADKRKIHIQVAERAASALIKKIEELVADAPESARWKFPLLLKREEVNAINLIIDGAYGYQTWLHRDVLNSIIIELKKTRELNPSNPFFAIPQQIQRHLIIDVEKKVWETAVYVRAIRDSFLRLETGDFITIQEEEIDCVCSFVASASIFGHLVFPDFEKSLLEIKYASMSVHPPFLEIPFGPGKQGEPPAFFRYFQPTPASIYFSRHLLFYQKNYGAFEIDHNLSGDDRIFGPFLNRCGDFSAVFCKWFKKRLSALGFKNPETLDIAGFRDACIMVSLLDYSSARHSLPSYPPFLLAIQSREIRGDSCLWGQFMLGLERRSDKESYQATIIDSTKDIERPGPPGLLDAINSIRNLIKPLTNRCLKKERVTAALAIKAIVESLRTSLPTGTFDNVMLYAEWIVGMLHIKKDNSKKKIINYSATVKNMMSNLPDDRPFHQLSKDEQKVVIKRTIDRYGTIGVKKELRSFLGFLKSYLGEQFTPPNLNSEDYKKENSKSPHPLIYPFHVEEAIGKAEEVFCRYALKLKEEGKKEHLVEQGRYKASIVSHMINLGYQGGIRASEFTNLKISDIIFDEGYCLCITTSKTENGIRILPLHLIVSDPYLSSFREHYQKRRKEALSTDDWLFPDYNGARWDSSHLASEVVRLFEEICIKNMRFHDLRHGFASWFLLRWFYTFHKERVPGDLPISDFEFFHERYLSRLGKLFIGMNSKKGQEVFTYALAVLAKIMGHGGPLVTMKEYIHTGDWLFYFLSKSMENLEIDLTSEQAQKFLQVSYHSLPEHLKGRKKKRVSFRAFLDLQTARIQRKKTRIPGRK